MAETGTTLANTPGDALDELFRTALIKATNRQLDVASLIDTSNTLAATSLLMAVTLYKTWLACNPADPNSHAIYFNYAVCLADNDDLAGAANALRETLRIKPDFEPAHINLGGVLERLGQPGQAVQAWSAFVETLSRVTPEAVTYKLLALKQIGRVFEVANQDSAAEDALFRSLSLDRTQRDVMQHLIALRQRQCKWPVLQGSDLVSVSNLRAAISPLSAAYYADDPIFQLATAYNYSKRDVGLPPKIQPKPPEGIASVIHPRRVRVGYVSSDLREHAVGFAMTDVIETHNRSDFEIFAYYCGIKSDDPVQRRTRRAAEHWTDLNGMSDVEAYHAICKDEIDILVDLNGYTKDARTKLFAMRPAPIAVNWFGFPGSLGSPYHQYIIADEHIIPSDHEMFYSENVLRLPCYQPNDRKRSVSRKSPSRIEVGLPEEDFVFCSMNGLQKLTGPIFDRWMSVLRQVSDSCLWLLSGTSDTNDRLRSRAVEHEISPTRIIFAEKMHNPDHLARIALADLFLDTFPYGAHTTASDAMWMGVPVLTIKGRSFASRVCSSLVNAAGIPEMVCNSIEEYESRAVHLATWPGELTQIKDRLRSGRDKSVLFDTPKLVGSLETLYQNIHRDRINGVLPKPDLLNLEIYHEIGTSMDLEQLDSSTASEYLTRYREQLRDLDEVFPVKHDARLWARKESTSVQRPTLSKKTSMLLT